MKQRSISLRARYLISYISITACACIVIGFLVMLHFNEEMNANAIQDYRAKLLLAANDMDTQQDILMNISHRVKTSSQYRPIFTSRNAFYERDVVEDIAKYENYSPIVSDYYVFLSHSDSVYSKMGKLSIDYFLRYKLGVWDDSITKEMLLSSSAFWTMAHPTQKNVILAIAPMRIMFSGESNMPDACMIFMIYHGDLMQRIERISGIAHASAEDIAVYRQDDLMIGNPAVTGTSVISSVSDSGVYKLLSTADLAQIYPRITTFQSYYLMLLSVLTVVITSIAGILAKRTYRPIHHLIGTLNITPDSSAQDVEKAVKILQDSQRYNKEQLHRELQKIADQRREIAKHLLFAKLNTAQDEKLDALMVEAGIALEHPLFCVLIVRSNGQEVTEGQMASLAKALSDDDVNVFSAGLYQPDCFILLLNFTAHGQEEEMATIIKESLELKGVTMELQAGVVCDDVSRLHLSLISALTRKEAASTLPAAGSHGSQPNWYDDKDVILLMEALREGNVLKAQTALGDLVKLIKSQYPSLLFQRSICADIINHLMKVLRELDMPLEHSSLYSILAASDIEDFEHTLSSGLIQDVCDTALRRREEVSNEKEQQVTAYIQEHLFSTEFSIYQVAEHFGLSERKVGSIVKRLTNRSYKEYVIDLRIERAKELLAKHQFNVSQTGESVGYSNIPYFIKLFRSYTGFTPGEYKKKFEK